MNIVKNEVTLDTCGCYFQQSVDLDDPTSVMSFDHFIRKCPVHANLTDEEAWKRVWLNPDSEQKRKNGLYRALTVDDPERFGVAEKRTEVRRRHSKTFNRAIVVRDANGDPVVDEFWDVPGGDQCYLWAFDANRCLCVALDGCQMDDATKQKIQDYCNQTFGPGKVQVVNANDVE